MIVSLDLNVIIVSIIVSLKLEETIPSTKKNIQREIPVTLRFDRLYSFYIHILKSYVWARIDEISILITSKIDYSNCGFPEKSGLQRQWRKFASFYAKKNDNIFHIFDQINGYVVLWVEHAYL